VCLPGGLIASRGKLERLLRRLSEPLRRRCRDLPAAFRLAAACLALGRLCIVASRVTGPAQTSGRHAGLFSEDAVRAHRGDPQTGNGRFDAGAGEPPPDYTLRCFVLAAGW
jgi:hypothetical protein